MTNPTVDLLSSGYWHVRWTDYLWLQWPKWRAPNLNDGFGWIAQHHVDTAITLTRKIARKEE